MQQGGWCHSWCLRRHIKGRRGCGSPLPFTSTTPRGTVRAPGACAHSARCAAALSVTAPACELDSCAQRGGTLVSSPGAASPPGSARARARSSSSPSVGAPRHAARHVDGVPEQRVAQTHGANHARDHGAAVEADAQADGPELRPLPVHRRAAGGGEHVAREARHAQRVVRLRLRQAGDAEELRRRAEGGAGLRGTQAGQAHSAWIRPDRTGTDPNGLRCPADPRGGGLLPKGAQGCGFSPRPRWSPL